GDCRAHAAGAPACGEAGHAPSLRFLVVPLYATRSLEEQREEHHESGAETGEQAHGDERAGVLCTDAEPAQCMTEVTADEQRTRDGTRLRQDQSVDGLAWRQQLTPLLQ